MAKILLVEDNPTELRALEWLLGKRDGHDVYIADKDKIAIHIFKEDKPFDIAIIDLGLSPFPNNPEIGFQLCKDLIEQEPELPIIIVTGIVVKEDLEERSKEIKNVRAFYPKPLDFVGIRNKVKEITSHNEA